MKVILRALQTAPPGLQQAASSSSYASSGKVNPAVAATAHSTVERVFDHCQQVPHLSLDLTWSHAQTGSTNQAMAT